MEKLSITYITNARIPTERAQGVQIMNTCGALANAGLDVELIVPLRFNALKDDPFIYYGLRENFKIKKLPNVDIGFLGPIGFWFQEWSFALSSYVYCLLAMKKENRVLYIRGERIFSALTSFVKKMTVYLESHMKPKDMGKQEKNFKMAKGIVVITKYYEQELKKLGLNTVCIADGVTIPVFDISISQEEARKKLGLQLDKKIVMYTGHLYSWKGADTLADAALMLPENVVTVFVGGSPEDLVPFQQRHKDNSRIMTLGIKPYRDMPEYQKAADILVLPNTKKEDVSVWYTSPIKLFEYMASGRPIVSSDLPSMRDVLNESNAAFATPDEAESFARVITLLLEQPEAARRLAAQARKDVENYSWDKRAQKIIEFIKPS